MQYYDTHSNVFHANGKLLLTGEYFVLDGALALALPTKQGQKLYAEEQESFGSISWESLDADGEVWFKGMFDKNDFRILSADNQEVARRLQQILEAARRQNDAFLKNGAIVRTELEFPGEWGLGTSSTLLYNIAQWADIDAHQLLEETFGGSGYDLACAGVNSAIFYRLESDIPRFFEFPFAPPFLDSVYFVYLGKKQNSREGIARYREKVKDAPDLIQTISELSEKIAQTSNFTEFNTLLLKHEELVAETIQLPRAKDLYFSDFWGEVKSLGAWGGDFVLVTSDKGESETKEYFKQKGMEVFIPYKDLIQG